MTVILMLSNIYHRICFIRIQFNFKKALFLFPLIFLIDSNTKIVNSLLVKQRIIAKPLRKFFTKRRNKHEADCSDISRPDKY